MRTDLTWTSHKVFLGGARTLGVLACWLTVCGCHRSEVPRSPPAESSVLVVDVVRISPRPFRDTLFTTGSLLARNWVNLRAERAGLVKEIRFEEGQSARAGEVLVLIDDSELQAQLTRAEVQLELAGLVEKRDRELFQGEALITAAQYDQSLANLRVAQAERDLIRAQLTKTRIVAPFDGMAGLRRISVGTYLTPGDIICTFQDIGSLRLDFSVPERYLGYVRLGQKVLFRVAGQSGTFEATISAIEPVIDVLTRSLQVRATAPNEGGRLLPGAFAEAEVVLDEIPDAILIPPIALVPGLQEQTVFVHRQGVAEGRRVQSGLRTADQVQIVAGLEVGEELITSGILQLRSGMKVRARSAAASSEGEGRSALRPPSAEESRGPQGPSPAPNPKGLP